MKSKPARRERRAFSAEFKAEAVRLVAERRAEGATLAQVGRELDVRPDQLRAWARQQRRTREGDAVLPGESMEQENRRLRREIAVLRQEQAFAKKVAGYFAKESRCEVRRHHSPSRRVRGATHVSGARGVSLGLLRVAPAPTELACAH